MALITHLPLNGNTEDYSGYGNHGSPTNVSWSSGKIGQAASFSGNGYVKITMDGFNPDSDFSMRFLVNPRSNSNYGLFSSRTAMGKGISMFVLNGSIRFDYGDVQWSSGVTVPLNTWTDLIFILKDENMIIYLDGVKVKERTKGNMINFNPSLASIGASQVSGSGWGNYLNGSMNDVRIYDHALSDFEIKELSKLLILHYDFSVNIPSVKNSYNYPSFETSSSGGGWSHWGQSGHAGKSGQVTTPEFIYGNQTYAHWVENGENATGNYLLYQSPSFKTGGGWRSLQCIIKMSDGSVVDNSKVYPAWNARSGGAENNTWTSVTPLENGFYLCKVDGIRQDGTNNLVGVYVQPGIKAYFSYMQLENDRKYGSNIIDGEMSSVIVKDSGPYRYNGEVLSSSSPMWDIETSIGFGSVYFNDDFNKIEVSSIGNLSGLTNCTISFWRKNDTAITDWLPFSGQTLKHYIMATANGTGAFYHSNSGSGIKIYKDGVYESGAVPFTDSSWHHYVATNVDLSSWTTFNIGGYSTSSNYEKLNMKGYITDIRIYAQSLSAEDIAKLYKTRAELSSDGTLYSKAVLEDITPTVNMLNESDTYIKKDTYSLKDYTFRITPEAGKTYTISLKGQLGEGKTYFGIYNSGGSISPTSLAPQHQGKDGVYRRTFTWSVGSSSNTFLRVYHMSSSTIVESVIEWIQLEEGDKSTPFVSTYRPYTPLPESIDFDKKGIHETGTWVTDEISTVGITDGLVAYWPFDKNANDYSGFGYNLTDPNNNVLISNGAVFTNDNSQKLFYSGFPEMQAPFTWSIFVKLNDNTETSQFIMSQGRDTGSIGFNIRTAWKNGKLQLTSSSGTISSGYDLIGKWTHIVATVEPDYTKLYINGEYFNQMVTTEIDYAQSSGAIVIGKMAHSYNNNSNYFPMNGEIKNAKVFNRALTPEEVKIEYNTMFANKMQVHNSGTLYVKDYEEY